jgi:hypothetical protein
VSKLTELVEAFRAAAYARLCKSRSRSICRGRNQTIPPGSRRIPSPPTPIWRKRYLSRGNRRESGDIARWINRARFAKFLPQQESCCFGSRAGPSNRENVAGINRARVHARAACNNKSAAYKLRVLCSEIRGLGRLAVERERETERGKEEAFLPWRGASTRAGSRIAA